MKKLFALLFVSSVASAKIHNSYDVCRTSQDEGTLKIYCQHMRNGKWHTDNRSVKTITGWVAIPCRQLKRLLPGVSCKKPLGMLKLGEPQVDE